MLDQRKTLCNERERKETDRKDHRGTTNTMEKEREEGRLKRAKKGRGGLVEALLVRRGVSEVNPRPSC